MKTLGSLALVNNEWVFDGVAPHVMIKLKSIFPKIPKGQVCPFSFKHTPETAVDLAWFVDRYPFKISDDDLDFLKRQKKFHLEQVAKAEEFLQPNYQHKIIDLKKPLREYQSQGVSLHGLVKRYLLGDVVGLGKTVTAIGTFFNPEAMPVAVVVQTHLPSQWKEKVEEFSNLKVHVVKNGPVYQLPPADVYIFKYTQLAKWVDILSSGYFKAMVCDEIQELRIEGSQKYSAARAIANKVEYFLGMSATPIYNYGDEIFNVLNLIKEGCLGERWDFLREWSSNGYIIKDPQALGSYLRENHLFLRRTRQETQRELPEINRIVEAVDSDDKALEAIEERAALLAQKVMQGEFVERGQAARDLDMMVRHATGVAKAAHVAQYVRMIVEAGEPVLLAGWHRDVYDIWNKELAGLNPVMYTGSESPKQKDEAKRKFISGESDIMMISLRSGIGLDGLQERASIVVIGELDWSPQIHEQIVGRLNRDGQKNQVTVIFLVSNSGSDPGIVDILGLKSSQSDGILDPFAQATVNEPDRNRIKELAQRYLHRKKGDTSEP